MLAADDNVTDTTATSQSRSNMVGTAHGTFPRPLAIQFAASLVWIQKKKARLGHMQPATSGVNSSVMRRPRQVLLGVIAAIVIVAVALGVGLGVGLSGGSGGQNKDPLVVATTGGASPGCLRGNAGEQGQRWEQGWRRFEASRACTFACSAF
jgi:hypothetical protein